MVDKFEFTAISTAPTWNGTDWVDAPTNNPASLVILVIKKLIGWNKLPSVSVNHEKFVEFYTHCKVNGFEYNRLLNAGIGFDDLSQEVCAAGRGLLLRKDDAFSVSFKK